jgi:hypothetical protein
MSKSDQEWLEIAYDICKHIQSHIKSSEPYNSMKSIEQRSDYYSDWNAGPNPCHSQVKDGLILQCYHETPSYIITPWGRWSILSIGASGNFKPLIEKLTTDLGLEIETEGYDDYYMGMHMGYYGPYWHITKWNGETLSKSQWKTKEDFMGYDESKNLFHQQFNSRILKNLSNRIIIT